MTPPVTDIVRFEGVYRFLSNFSPAPLTVLFTNHPDHTTWEWVLVPTVEHAFQASKAACLQDFKRVCVQPTPGRAKAIGRRIRLRADWDEVKDELMLDLVRAKFQNFELRSRLLQTGHVQLVEGNTWGDRYWGVCAGYGENKLGKILMQVRQELRGDPIELPEWLRG